MTSPNNWDRISELPEPLIIDIISRLPLDDAARASILSKTWKSYCGLYPILYFDHKIHNMFALQSLLSAKEGGREQVINQIRTMFMDDVDYHLSRANLLNYPIRKLTLIVCINDSVDFSRVDTWLELVRQLNVEDFCVSVQSAVSLQESRINKGSIVYEFPVSMLGSKGLRSVCVRGCKLVCDTFVPDLVNKSGVSFFSLKSLLNVYTNEDVLEELIRFCQGIETLVLQKGTVEIKFLKLSKFPKLKTAVIEPYYYTLESVDIVGTNLECLTMEFRNVQVEINMSPEACAGIRDLTLTSCAFNQPGVFKDLTATFPSTEVLNVSFEEVYRGIRIHEIDTRTVKATGNALRELYFDISLQMMIQEVYIDCPNLTVLWCAASRLTDLYVDCPKLKKFYYDSSRVHSRTSVL